jgi:hypothetical protein
MSDAKPRNPNVEKMADTLFANSELRYRVAAFLFEDGLEDENAQEVAEAVAIATFGARVECKTNGCGALVLPGLVCWNCEEPQA